MRKKFAKTLLLFCLLAVCATVAADSIDDTVAVADLPAEPAALPDPPTGGELSDLAEEYGETRRLFRDHDNLRWQWAIPGGTDRIRSWLQIYRAYEDDRPAFPDPAPLPGGDRIISYATIPQSDAEKSILMENLTFYRSAGYTGVLLLISKPADPAAFTALVRQIREDFGLKVWAAFSPTGNVEHPESVSLPDPAAFTAFLSAIAPEIDAYLLACGRTGSHLFLQDDAFLYTVTSALRTGKPDLPLLGDHYYGYSSRARKDGYRYWSSNLCRSASANLVVNRGTVLVDQKTVVRRFGTPCVGVVTGRRTYWISRTRDDWQTALAHKRKIEDRYLAAGAIATVTEHGDGTEHSLSLRSRKFLTNDLSKTRYNEF